ncbi:hypothetical protein T439DRAFT_360879 [Meredithblackwellia eburnea MCA 4105]
MRTTCVVLPAAAVAFQIVAVLPSLATAFSYEVGVGKDETTGYPGIGFDPSRSVPVNGDSIVFTMLQGSHQVIEGTSSTPCAPGGGFDTGLQSVPNGTVEGGPTFTFQVTDSSKPTFFYDAAGDNCQKGAVFCLNTDETSTTESCHAYKAAALALASGSGTTTTPSTTSGTAIWSTSIPSNSSASHLIGGTSTTSTSSLASETSKSAAARASRGLRGWSTKSVVALLVGLVGIGM